MEIESSNQKKAEKPFIRNTISTVSARLSPTFWILLQVTPALGKKYLTKYKKDQLRAISYSPKKYDIPTENRYETSPLMYQTCKACKLAKYCGEVLYK